MDFNNADKSDEQSEVDVCRISETIRPADSDNVESSWDFVVAEQTITVHPTVLSVALAASQCNLPVKKRYYLTSKDFEDIIAGEKTMDDYAGLFNEKSSTSKKVSRGSSRVSITLTPTVSRSATPMLESEPPAKKRFKPDPIKSTKKKPAYRCKICKGTKLRVVDYGAYSNSHGKNILECCNLNCLSTVALVDEPAGTVYEPPDGSPKNFGWYLWEQSLWMYPPLDVVHDAYEVGPEALQEELSKLTPQRNVREEKCMMIRCPGQRKLVKLV